MEEIQGSEYLFLNLLSEIDIDDEIWNNVKIDKKLLRKTI